jgi:hypothetical protein
LFVDGLVVEINARGVAVFILQAQRAGHYIADFADVCSWVASLQLKRFDNTGLTVSGRSSASHKVEVKYGFFGAGVFGDAGDFVETVVC